MSERPGQRRIGRSIVAVLACLVAIVVLSVATDAVCFATGVFPPRTEAVWVLPTAYRFLYGVLGCAIAARVAPNRPMRHALVLGAIGLLAGAAGAVASWDKPDMGPRWYGIAVMASTVPCAWIGGRLGCAASRKVAGPA